jgi:hypothetical protein
MQRAAANSIEESKSDTKSPTTKVSNAAPSRSDLLVYKQAVEAEEAARVAALERQIRDSGETRWTLSYHKTGTLREPAVHVIQTGFAGIDTEEFEEDIGTAPNMTTNGRKSFGGFKKTPEKANTQLNSESEESSESEEEREPLEPVRLKEYKGSVNGSTKGSPLSISKSNTARKTGLAGLADRRCHLCNQLGHLKNDCPQKESRSSKTILEQLERKGKRAMELEDEKPNKRRRNGAPKTRE